MYKHHTIQLIAEEFGKQDIKFQVKEIQDEETLEMGVLMHGRPFVIHFITNGDGNDLSVRIHAVFPEVPEELQPLMLKAANGLNDKYRFIKFSLDDDGNLDMSYDLLHGIADQDLGRCAVEIMVCLFKILHEEYEGLLLTLLSGDGIPYMEKETFRSKETNKLVS